MSERSGLKSLCSVCRIVAGVAFGFPNELAGHLPLIVSQCQQLKRNRPRIAGPVGYR